MGEAALVLPCPDPVGTSSAPTPPGTAASPGSALCCSPSGLAPSRGTARGDPAPRCCPRGFGALCFLPTAAGCLPAATGALGGGIRPTRQAARSGPATSVPPGPSLHPPGPGGGSGGEERPLALLGAEAGADAGHPGSVAAQRSCGTRDAPGSMWQGHQGPHRHHSCGGHGAEWHGRYQQLSLRRPRPSVAADTHRQE